MTLAPAVNKNYDLAISSAKQSVVRALYWVTSTNNNLSIDPIQWARQGLVWHRGLWRPGCLRSSIPSHPWSGRGYGGRCELANAATRRH